MWREPLIDGSKVQTVETWKNYAVIIPKSAWSRLLFSRYSYTRRCIFPSMQHPYNLTRLRCCTADMVATSAINWLFPWWDLTESFFTATTFPSERLPYKVLWLSNVEIQVFLSKTFHCMSGQHHDYMLKM